MNNIVFLKTFRGPVAFLILLASSVFATPCVQASGLESSKSLSRVSTLLGKSADEVFARLGKPDSSSRYALVVDGNDALVIVHLYKIGDGARFAVLFDVETTRVIALVYDSFARANPPKLSDFNLRLRLRPLTGTPPTSGDLTNHLGMLAGAWDSGLPIPHVTFAAIFQLTSADQKYDALDDEVEYKMPEHPSQRQTYAWALSTLCGLGSDPAELLMSDKERDRYEANLSATVDDPLTRDPADFSQREFGERLHINDAALDFQMCSRN